MAKSNSKSKRKFIGIVSADGKTRLYTSINPQNRTNSSKDKLTLKKYNPKTRQHEVFTETKKNLGRNEVKPKKH